MPRTWSLPALPKATLEDPNDQTLGWTVQHTAGPTHLQVYSIAKTLGGRTDTATVTSGSSTITDTSIAAADFGKQVSGPGIPPESYVGTVTVGTSFVLSSNPYTSTAVLATAAGTAVNIGPAVYPWRGAGTFPTTLAAPGIATSTTGGTGLLAATTYSYAYSYLSPWGESVLSAVATQLTGAGGTNSVTVTPAALPAWATGVNIYGRLTTGGAPLVLLQTQATAAAWIDTGATAVTITNGAVTSVVLASVSLGIHTNSGRNEAAAGVTH